MPTTSASSLKKTNQELKAQINVLFGEIENLKSQLGVNGDDESTAAAAAAAATTTTTAAEQTVKDHRSPTNEHSDFQSVQTRAEAELKRLSTCLAQVSAKVDEVGKVIDTFEEYSYQYNIKIVGVPELNSQETAMDMSKLCVNLFIAMGADITFQDIDIAHQVPLRSAGNLPKPIICKFTRRLAKELVMLAGKMPANLFLPTLVCLTEFFYPQSESSTTSHPKCKLSSPKRRNLNLITTLNSVGPRIHVFIFVRTGIPVC